MTGEHSMAEEWIPYLRNLGGVPLSAMVDVQYAGGVLRACPTLVKIQAKLPEPGPHGLGETESTARLDELFDEFIASGMAGVECRFVVRERSGGRATFLIYSSAQHADEVAKRGMEALKAYSPTLEVRHDPDWSEYNDSLPTLQEVRKVQDLMVVSALQEHGDLLEPKRDVTHYAYFDLESQADEFAKAVAALGFKIERSGGDDKHGVIATRKDSVTPEAITSVTVPLAELAMKIGGEYDGWEAPLVKKQGLLGRLFAR